MKFWGNGHLLNERRIGGNRKHLLIAEQLMRRDVCLLRTAFSNGKNPFKARSGGWREGVKFAAFAQALAGDAGIVLMLEHHIFKEKLLHKPLFR